jgi:hypothetical protein
VVSSCGNLTLLLASGLADIKSGLAAVWNFGLAEVWQWDGPAVLRPRQPHQEPLR